MVDIAELMKVIDYIKDSIDKQNKNIFSSVNLSIGPLGVGFNPEPLWEKSKKML